MNVCRLLFLLMILIDLSVAQAQVFIPMAYWRPRALNLTISDGPTYTFPAVSAGATVEKTFTLSNTDIYAASSVSGGAFSLSNFAFKGGAFPGTGGSCLSVLPASSSCAFVVTATSAMDGTYNDSVGINYFIAGAPASSTRAISFTSTANTSPTITTIASRNIYEGNYPYIPFQIYDAESILTCSGANLSVTSSNNTVVPPANITYTGLAPFCYLNVIPVAGVTGSSDIVLTVHDLGTPNKTASTSFTVTSVPIVSISVLPKFSVIPQNSTFQFSALATYSDATTVDISPSVSWSVPVSAAYTINSFNSGLLNLGAVTGFPSPIITGTYLVLSNTVSSTFNASTITGLFVTPSAASLNVSGTVDLKCIGTTADGGSLDLTTACNWASTNSAIANVNNFSPKGQVMGVSLGGPLPVSATYSTFSASSTITVSSGPPVVTEVGTGLFARYFTGMGFNIFYRQRVDANIAFAWGTGSNPAGGANLMSVVWTGQILAPETGTYTFYSSSDDGFKVWVNDVLIDDFWTDHGTTASSGNAALVAGTKYNIVVHFYENGGGAEAHLRWKIPSSACASYAACPYIAQRYLFPTSGQGMPFTIAGTGDSVPTDRDFVNDGIVRYYNADGSGNIASGSTITAQTGINMTAQNTNGTGLSYVTGLIGQAFSFDGVDDNFTSANTNLATGTNARSFSFWIKPNVVGAEQGIFFYGANTTNNGFGATLLANGTFRAHGGLAQVCDSAVGAITFGQWNHVSIRYTSGTVVITVNGVDTSCARAWNTSAGNFYLGQNPNVAQRFSGEIDEFAHWNVNYGTNANNYLPTIIYQIQKPSPDYVP